MYEACLYDAAWVLVKAILEAQNTEGSIIKKILPKICYDYFGASGWCALNRAGDRGFSNYGIWRYGRINDGSVILQFFVDPQQEQMTESGELDLITFLKKNDQIKQLGLTVESCDPNVDGPWGCARRAGTDCADCRGAPSAAMRSSRDGHVGDRRSAHL